MTSRHPGPVENKSFLRRTLVHDHCTDEVPTPEQWNTFLPPITSNCSTEVHHRWCDFTDYNGCGCRNSKTDQEAVKGGGGGEGGRGGRGTHEPTAPAAQVQAPYWRDGRLRPSTQPATQMFPPVTSAANSAACQWNRSPVEPDRF